MQTIYRLALCVSLAALAPACATRVPGGVVPTTPGVFMRGDGILVEPTKPFVPSTFLDVWRYDDDLKMTELYRQWEARGASRVAITVPGRTTTLYGLISFHRLPASAEGPGSRSYSLNIPDQYIRDASDGRISVVYELVKTDSGKRYFGWVLWMSDRPF